MKLKELYKKILYKMSLLLKKYLKIEKKENDEEKIDQPHYILEIQDVYVKPKSDFTK